MASRRLARLRDEAAGCRACDLWKTGTQTVFGEGPAPADLMFVGEQPGDQEDLKGRPFVGPAGRLFRTMLEEAGVDAGSVYVTNAVKHFKWEPRGRRRLHKRPNVTEMNACHPWLASELAVVRPALVVALGAVAARALTGRNVAVTKERGRIFDVNPPVLITVHPSSILRLQDTAERPVEIAKLVADFSAAREWVSGPGFGENAVQPRKSITGGL